MHVLSLLVCGNEGFFTKLCMSGRERSIWQGFNFSEILFPSLLFVLTGLALLHEHLRLLFVSVMKNRILLFLGEKKYCISSAFKSRGRGAGCALA